MKEVTFDVPDISCEHCVNAITDATKGLGVETVQVDLPSKKVYLAFDPNRVSEQALKAAIEDEGYGITGRVEGRTMAPNKPKLVEHLI